MKNAPTTNSSESAPNKRDCTPGTFPKRVNTVRADVLSNLLELNTLSGMASVFAQSTTRLSAVIFALCKKYGWHFETRNEVTATEDGRITRISLYWLPQETIAKAFEIGAREWIEKVKAARVKQRQQASKRKSEVARINANRNQRFKQDPRQCALWGEM